MKNIKIFAFLAIFLLAAAVSTAWAVDVTLTYRIEVQSTNLKPVAHIYNAATGEEVASWDHGFKTLWPANEGHTMNDGYGITFTPNQELDKTDKNEKNKSTSTTAFRTEKETFFTVSVGKEGFYLKSVTFKEDANEKASSSNIAPNSTSIRVDVPENKFFNYITVVLTVDAYTVSVPENLTISDAFATISGVNYYKSGETVTFGFSGSGSVVYFVNGERIEGNSVIVGQEDLTVEIGIPYIDENGKEQIRKPGDYTVLTEDNKPNENGIINLPGGWYVVQGKVKYASQVKFSGEVHLILADGAEMVIESKSRFGIYALNNLTIYGQSGQGGILNVTAKGSFVCGIYSSNGRITISGGSVTATGTNYPGIYGDKGVSISGGKVTATGPNEGISSYSGNITLGWTNSTDYIYANGYSISDYEKHVSIAEGKAFKDEKGYVYRGTLTKGQVSDFKGQKLEPFEGVSVSFVDNFSGASDVFAEIAVDGEGHVSAPSKHPFHSGYAFVGWFTSPEGGSEFDFTVKVTENTTAYAHWNENTPVEYIDENGGTNETKNYILFTNDIYVEDDLPGGWYVVEGEVKYTNQVKFSGDAHLILADGAKMEIETEGEYGIYATKNLTIYGQNGQSGILNATANGSSGNGIYSRYGDITISGGKVTVTGSSSGIYGSNGVTISGGSVTATGSNYGIYGYDGVTISGGSVTATGENGVGIYSVFGNITISGGKVTATGDDGIYSYDGNITLGWTNSTDFIYASSYYCEKGSVSIAEGKSFKDEKDIVYSGTLTGEQLSAIKGKKLEPCYAVTFDAQNGDDPIMLLTTFDENGVAYVKKPNDPIRSGFTFDGWFTATDGNTEFDFTKAVTENTAAYAKWSIPYIDENGKEQIRKPGEYTVLTSLTDVSNLGGGWYVVQGKVKYSNQVNFGGEAHLILADGAEMEIETESKYGIYASNNLTIYGQSGQGGILNATANGKIGSGIYGKGTVTIIGGTVEASGTNGYGIYGDKGVTISGGTVTATSTNGSGIYGYNGVTISGGSVEAVGKYGIDGSKGVTISGGTVTATGIGFYGIHSSIGNITLGWTNSTDSIKASSYYGKNGVSIAEGKSFKDEKGIVYSGTLTGEQLSAIKGNRLEPCYAVTFDAQNGDDPIMLLTTFDENGVAYVKKPNDPIRSCFTFEGWFTATDGNTEFDFSAAITGNTTAYAKWKENALVEYIDENGAPKSVTDYTVLTSLTDVSNLGGGWYVVQGKVEYTNQVKFSGDAHLILADGAEMVIETEGELEHGIYASNNLTIYGQNEQRGILNATATGTIRSGIYSSKGNITINGGKVTATGTNCSGIRSSKGNITINGGKVTATSSSDCISGYNGVTINGGKVTATSTIGVGISGYNGVTINGGIVTATGLYGIDCYNGGVTISGGSVTATANYDGIYNDKGNITLGWTNSTDFIKVSSYYSNKGSVQIAEGKSFKDEKGIVYSGTLTGEQLSAIKGNRLEPCYAVTFDAQNGDDPIMLLTSFDENGVAHVKKPNDPIRSGFSFEGWFAAPEGGSEFDFTKAVTGNTTAYAHWNENTPVEYIDENGGTNETKNYILLTNGIKVDNLPGGWYVVQGEVKYSNQVMFSGEAHLILADGAKMVIKSESMYGIYALNNLTIYGQSGQGGILNDTAKGTNGIGIFSYIGNVTINGGKVTVTGNKNGIYSVFGDITINGGSVTASGDYDGIYGGNGVTISGGSVTATGNYGIYGGSEVGGNGVTISGGKVTATGSSYGICGGNGVTISGGSVTVTSKDGDGIYGYKGNITLGWTNSTDFIYASSYSLSDNEKHVSIVEGKSFKDDKDNVYSGTINPVSDIAGKTLVPAKPFPDNMDIAHIPDQTYTGDSICPKAVLTMSAGVGSLVEGEDYKVVCKENLNAGTATLSVRGIGIYVGAIEKTFTIAQAPLTITAKNKIIAYGDDPANDGVEYDGFVGKENASVLGGKLTYSYDYKKLDKVGKYTITPSGLTASNYEISFVAGALNVEPKATHYAAVQVLEDENGKRAEIDGEYGEIDGIVITEPLEVASVEFSRDFSTQGYSTIVLPFDVNTSKLSGVDSVLSFARIVKEQGEMAVGMKVVWEASASHVDLKANTPYMVKMTGAKLGIDGGVTLLPTEAAVTKSDAQNDGWEFRGTYAYKSWQEGDEDLCRVYGFAGGSNDEVSEGDFVKFTAGASLRPLRAYLINTNRTCGAPKMARAYGDYVLGAKSSIDDLPESMKVVIVGEDGYTTVIGHFNTRTGEFTTGTSVRKFDLKGRAVRGTPSARGAYYGKRVKK